MKKKVVGRKLSRGQGARRALFRALLSSLVTEGKIVTTKAKAKSLISMVDKLVNLAKDGNVSKKRQLSKILGNDRKTLKVLVSKVAPVFSDRNGGYTRIVNLPRRRGDYAEMAKIEWVKETTEKGTAGSTGKESKAGKKELESKTEEIKSRRRGILRRKKEK